MWDVEPTKELGDMVVARVWYCKAFYHGNQRCSQQRSRTMHWVLSVWQENSKNSSSFLTLEGI